MLFVPLLYASLVSFSSAEPCSIALLPADETDVSVALVEKDLNQLLAVFRLVLVNSSNIVWGVGSCLEDICAVLFADDTEELCKIYFVVITCLDCGSHLCVRAVADDDSLASCCAELLNRCCYLFRYVTLVYILNLNAECLCSLVDHQLAL